MASIRTAGLTKDFGDLRAVNEIDLDNGRTRAYSDGAAWQASSAAC